MKITIPELSLVVLIGPSGAGKSTFARRCFKPTEVLSSDTCRALVADDENDQTATADAFDVLHHIAGKRLAAGRLTVVDATNVRKEDRAPLVALARRYHCLPVAIVLDVPERDCIERNRLRPDRDFGANVVLHQAQAMRRSLGGLEREGFRHAHVLAADELGEVEVERQPLWNNRTGESGPFDIVGDVHGCFDELAELLRKLGYQVLEPAEPGAGHRVIAPEGRRLVFLGDLVDRGPRIVDVLRLVMSACADGVALCVPGNHDVKLLRYLRGRQVQPTHGLPLTLAELAKGSEEFSAEVAAFLDGLVSHYVFDGGRLVVAHAGLRAEMQGRGSREVREFCLYGETTGEHDEYGLPVRLDWAADYRGQAMVVYGHVPVLEAEWVNRTIDLDTGCVFGGKLTALRYPERELVAVPARREYNAPARPLAARTGTERPGDLLDLEDVTGKRQIATALAGLVTIREANAQAALEVISRFAVDPRWLIYLPPTMSPCETSKLAGLLEHPAEAFGYYRAHGVETVICEEKHMGSRVVCIVGRDEPAIARRFGLAGAGVCYTRTGRAFFGDPATEAALLARLRAAATAAGLWDELGTDWCCLDAELMPWSAKAQGLLRGQYAPVGAAARAALGESVAVMETAAGRGLDVAELLATERERAAMAEAYTAAYRRYCWPIEGLTGVKLAPFHLLASEGKVHAERDHRWHLAQAAKLAAADPELLVATPHRVVATGDEAQVAEAVEWWTELTATGGEGMVVKPLDFVARREGKLLQPAVKCRGREYLRIIYGPEYTAPANLARLRSRGLGLKRTLALREFGLGLEALDRFVRGEPLYAVHEAVFGVLALESEPVDARL